VQQQVVPLICAAGSRGPAATGPWTDQPNPPEPPPNSPPVISAMPLDPLHEVVEAWPHPRRRAPEWQQLRDLRGRRPSPVVAEPAKVAQAERRFYEN
jgi:hypothetical protein